eukprot:NODE_21959_length_729_cov_1.498339.p3 GENE.NODE_21959_length_729_cov_1.498339~~NODE_21959_length_729_cov_1.498339.p3  ORF type:complete len:87 (+),score=36.38 NODE_21959_length_729_cov_1.498339:364-624(+)
MNYCTGRARAFFTVPVIGGSLLCGCSTNDGPRPDAAGDSPHVCVEHHGVDEICTILIPSPKKKKKKKKKKKNQTKKKKTLKKKKKS